MPADRRTRISFELYISEGNIVPLKQVFPSPILFVCPRCKGPLASTAQKHACSQCAREYPVICGIPDFRLEPDPYISIDDDRGKGEVLAHEGERRRFEDVLRHYYAVTPEDPPDLAARWIAHSLEGVAIAESLLRDSRVGPGSGRGSEALLDVGCSTGALLIAARQSYPVLVGVDVAFRWLVVGQVRLRDAGVQATLVCANAEHLPFPDGSFQAVTCTDTLEHVHDARLTVGEISRVSSARSAVVCTANNRYAPLPEPNIHLWGIGYLPRSWQAAYVAARRDDLHRYRVCLRSARELARLFRAAGYRNIRVEPAPLSAPHGKNRALQRCIALYNVLRTQPLIRQVLTMAGPRLRVTAERLPLGAAEASSSSWSRS